MSERLVPLDAIHLLPPEVTTIRELREFVRFDELQAAHPIHDLFIVVMKKLPGNACAFVMRLRKDVHIQDRWPDLVDYVTRVVTVYAVGQLPLGDGRVG